MTITTYPATAVEAFRLFDVEVVAASRLSPNMVRLTFAGPELEHMTSGGLDQRIKLVFPAEGQSEVVVPSGPRPLRAMRELPVHLRPRLRTYTVSAFRPRQEQLDVDFVLHGEGPGASFAMRAVPGDRLLIYAPNAEYPHGSRLYGVEYRMDALQGRTLLVGDETALPAIGAILRELPVGVHAKVFAEIPEEDDALPLPSAADVELHWLPREGAPGTAVEKAVRAADLSGADWYAWVAGEANMVTGVRRHLVSERGWSRDAVTFMGYWRQGRSEDDPQAD